MGPPVTRQSPIPPLTSPDQWSPALTLKTALLSVQALLTAAEPDDPQDAEVARQYKTDRAQFNTTARFWTESFARPPGSQDDAVLRIVAMGFDAPAVRTALAKAAGDEAAALELLLTGM